MLLPASARGPGALRGSCRTGLFVSSSSRSQSLDAYLNWLDLGVKRGFGSEQKSSTLPCRSIRLFLAVKGTRGCREGVSCASGELVLKNSCFVGVGGTGATIKYDGERSDLLCGPTPSGREISVIRSNGCG